MARISEDIRFYLPSDPYYYKVDNLPLQDLLKNDRRLQTQIDELQQADVGVTVNRNGILELKPFIDNGIPGTISVNPGSFIGRVQRSSGGEGAPASTLNGVYNGTEEIGSQPTIPDPDPLYADWTYNTANPPAREQNPAYSVGRMAVFNFPGGNISIDGWNEGDFQSVKSPDIVNAPRGRIDVVGITTVNGALDDPFIPGNAEELNIAIGNGQCKLAVVKGAGLVSTVTDNQKREVGITIGERYQTIGQPLAQMNVNTKNPDGTLTTDPRVGTYPMPDDVVNVCFSRSDIREGILNEGLKAWAQRNRNASFFLPIAYVYVNDTHQPNNPIPPTWLYDIRPFFRTAELTLAERQALAASVNPSVSNPVVTASYQEMRLEEEVNRNTLWANVQEQLDVLRAQLSSAFANIKGSLVVSIGQQTIPLSTSWTNYFPTLEAAVPSDATHIIIRGSVYADGGDGQNSPYISAQGNVGTMTVAQARGSTGDSIESQDTNQMIIGLIPEETPGSGGYIKTRKVGVTGGSGASLVIQGYLNDVSNIVTFIPPSAPPT